MSRYRVVYMPWHTWPYFVQVRRFFGYWIDVRDFNNEAAAIEFARMLTSGPRVLFDSNAGDYQSTSGVAHE